MSRGDTETIRLRENVKILFDTSWETDEFLSI